MSIPPAIVAQTAGDGIQLAQPTGVNPAAVPLSPQASDRIAVVRPGDPTNYYADVSGLGGGGGGGGGVLMAHITITGDQLTTLISEPLTVIPAPGPGKTILIVGATMQSLATSAYNGAADSSLALGFDTGGNKQYWFSGPTGNTTSVLSAMTADGNEKDLGAATNASLIVASGGSTGGSHDMGPWGTIASVTVDSDNPGSGYAPGDTGTLSALSADATYIIDTVGDGGAVLTLHLDNAGTGYTTNTMPTVTGGAQPGGGDGNLQIVVETVINQLGPARIDVMYQIVDVLS